MKLLKNKVNSSADGTYPLGKIRDDSGNNISGSQVNAEFMNDYVQFMEKMFADSGLTANGNPDNGTNGYQLFDAFKVSLRKNKGFLVGDFFITQSSTNAPVISFTYFNELGTASINLNYDFNGRTTIRLVKIGLLSSKVSATFNTFDRNLSGSPLREANIEQIFQNGANTVDIAIINRQISGGSIGSPINDYEGILKIAIYD